jgi:hypothetical protein
MKKLFLFAMTLALLASCKKDDDPAPPAPKPVESTPLNRTFFVNLPVTITASGSGNYEYGMKFSVTQNGKVTKLFTRMPSAGTYRITLWDASASPQTPLATANITQAAGAITAQAITPAQLTTGKDYFISVWSNTNWYQIAPAAGGSFPYPISIGSVVIKAYQWRSSPQNPQGFPNNVDNSYIAGLPDFEFQPD